VAATVVVAAAVTAVALAAAVVAAAAVVVTAVAVAATKQLPPENISNQKRAFGPFFVASTQRYQASVMRFLRGRPDKTLSYNQLGNRRRALATTPICQGITR
jgi:hypothetical protein